MPRGSAPAPPRTETPTGLREMAARARRLASATLDELTASKLTEFSKELEARAATLEPGAQTFSHDDAVAVQRADPDVGES
jgi:hypothetical protein